MINARVAAAFDSDDNNEFTPRAFMHGNTYAGHPLACAAALANLRIVEQENLPANAAEVGKYLLGRLKELEPRHRNIGDVRGLGLMIGIELVADKTSRVPLSADKVGHVVVECLRRGVIMVPCGRNGNVLRIMPSLTIPRDYLFGAIDIVADVLAACRP